MVKVMNNLLHFISQIFTTLSSLRCALLVSGLLRSEPISRIFKSKYYTKKSPKYQECIWGFGKVFLNYSFLDIPFFPDFFPHLLYNLFSFSGYAEVPFLHFLSHPFSSNSPIAPMLRIRHISTHNSIASLSCSSQGSSAPFFLMIGAGCVVSSLVALSADAHPKAIKTNPINARVEYRIIGFSEGRRMLYGLQEKHHKS